jgi:hypothetical protein
MDERQHAAWMWACLTAPDESCMCHRQLSFEKIQTAEYVERWKKNSDIPHPSMFIAWNPRCPIHGFPSDSPEYAQGITCSESWDVWLPRWEKLMAMEATQC